MKSLTPNPSPIERGVKSIFIKKQFVNLWRPKAKHNQLPPWGIEGAYNS